jgi:ATP-dependent protease ClpP protease subunit
MKDEKLKTKNNTAHSIEAKKENKDKKDNIKSRIDTIGDEIKNNLKKLQETRGGTRCYPFLLYNTDITDRVVDDVFDELRESYTDCNGRLDVLVFSSGGDIDAAYNLGLLFRRYAKNELNFIIGRWAKSAATLLVCSGNTILMSPIAELGPLDPQITELNPMEQRLEKFSPLHIEATLNLIRDEYSKGHEKLAQGLLERLQFPLTLGSFKKSVDIGINYATRLLSSRMLKGEKKEEKAEEIAKKLTTGYADHSFCIDIDEAKSIGLNAFELKGTELNIVWNIHKLQREREELKAAQKRKENEKFLKNLPPELRKILPNNESTSGTVTSPDV